MKPETRISQTGIGASDELRLRVSVASLVRVLFRHPNDGELMLALERRATRCEDENGQMVHVQSQPFGGAVRIYDLEALRKRIGAFHFDSEQSRVEQDFRLFIRPSDWEALHQFCLDQFNGAKDGILETGPERELAEEFLDTLNTELKPHQYACKPIGTVLENEPSPTENHAARGYPTVRVYRIFEAHILDASLSHRMLENSDKPSDELAKLAVENARMGRPGWANGVLTLPVARVSQFYLTLSPGLLNMPVSFQHHKLDETVAAVMEDIVVEKYQRL